MNLTGLSLDEARSQYDAMKKKGLGESTSKDMGKLSTYIRDLKSGRVSPSGTSSVSSGSSMGFPDVSAYKNKIQSYLDTARAKYGVPEAQKAVTGATGAVNTITGQLEALPQQVTNEVRGFDVNEAQRQQILQERQALLATQYGQAARTLENATTAYNLANQAMTQDVNAYTDAMKTELDSLIQKWQMGVQLSEAEKSRAADLAKMEKQAQIDKDVLSYKSGLDSSNLNLQADLNLKTYKDQLAAQQAQAVIDKASRDQQAIKEAEQEATKSAELVDAENRLVLAEQGMKRAEAMPNSRARGMSLSHAKSTLKAAQDAVNRLKGK